MKTFVGPTWETLAIFEKPVRGKNLSFVEIPHFQPEGVEEKVRAQWEKQVDDKLVELRAKGIAVEKRPYAEDAGKNPLSALYEGAKAKMWPGSAITLHDFSEKKTGIELHVSQTSFPAIKALSDPDIIESYRLAHAPLPRPALAVCTFARTQDDYLALTVRGPKTNMYPGRLYGQGGNPTDTKKTVVEHQLDEMASEISVGEKQVRPSSFTFFGIVVDNDQLKRKPDLVGIVDVRRDTWRLKEQMRKRTSFEPDAIDVLFAPVDPGGLHDYLVMRTHPSWFCPAAHGGLALIGRAFYGDGWLNDVLKDMK